MLNEKFILEHMNEIAELRDFDEVYEYFLANDMQVNAAEIMALKDSPNLANKLEANSQVLTMRQLDCVAGGWDNNGTNIALTVGGTVVGVIAAALTCGVGAAVVAGIFGLLGIGISAHTTLSSKSAENKAIQEQINIGVSDTGMHNNMG